MYFEHEIDLQTRNKAWLKEHNEIVQEVVTPVAYDSSSFILIAV